MTNLELVADWLHDTLTQNGLESGLRVLADWARDLNPLERELVRSTALDVVHGFVDFPAWRPTYGERRRTTERLVSAALGDRV